MISRRNQCLELARIFRRRAAEAQQDELKAMRYGDLAREYESEAKHGDGYS